MADDQFTRPPAPRSTCPQCGRFSDRSTLTIEPSGVWTGVYLCPDGRHQWLAKWLPGEYVGPEREVA